MVIPKPDQLTPYQKLALIRAHTGHRIQLQEFEEFGTCMFTVDLVIIVIQTVSFTAARATATITRRGTRTITIERRAGAWTRPVSVVTWTDEENRTQVVSDMPHTSALERLLWEQLCYRPGSPSQPLDSYARQLQGYYPDEQG